MLQRVTLAPVWDRAIIVMVGRVHTQAFACKLLPQGAEIGPIEAILVCLNPGIATGEDCAQIRQKTRCKRG